VSNSSAFQYLLQKKQHCNPKTTGEEVEEGGEDEDEDEDETWDVIWTAVYHLFFWGNLPFLSLSILAGMIRTVVDVERRHPSAFEKKNPDSVCLLLFY
jgi:hypothetical protein